MLLELALSSSFCLLQYQHHGTANQLLYRVQDGYAWPCKAPCDGTDPIRYQGQFAVPWLNTNGHDETGGANLPRPPEAIQPRVNVWACG
jgi:hypothetical protein